jgi:anti-anti-sigma factor
VSTNSAAEIVVTAPGEVDIATAPELADRLAEACALHPARVVVDFAGSTFCDSSAVEVLLPAAAELRANGCLLEVRSPNRSLLRISDVLGLSTELA